MNKTLIEKMNGIFYEYATWKNILIVWSGVLLIGLTLHYGGKI